MAARRDDGFTLIEVMIVVVLLGVLAAVVVFSVSGITDTGRESACASDESSMTVAAEAARAQVGVYVDESSLEALGYIQEQSRYHDAVDRAGAAPVSTAVVVNGTPVTVNELPNGYAITPDLANASPCT